METLLSKREKEEKIKAGIATGGITLLVLLLLILVGFKATQKDEGGSGGVEVQMGDPNQGGPDDSPANQRIVPVTPQQVETEDFTTNQEDGVAVNERQKPRKPQQTTPTQTQPVPEQPKIESALEKAMREARESRGQGTGNIPGTQGEPDGTGNSPTGGGSGTGGTGTGVGSGTGDGFKLGQGFGNRNITHKPKITSRCTDAKGGRVIFKVEVAPNGSVVRVLNENTGERGTNVSDPCLMREAIDLVKKVRLSSISGSTNTIGEITITIKN